MTLVIVYFGSLECVYANSGTGYRHLCLETREFPVLVEGRARDKWLATYSAHRQRPWDLMSMGQSELAFPTTFTIWITTAPYYNSSELLVSRSPRSGTSSMYTARLSVFIFSSKLLRTSTTASHTLQWKAITTRVKVSIWTVRSSTWA